MRIALMTLLFAFAAAPFLLQAPAADAVGICSQYTDSRCDGWIVCIGYRWSYPNHFECTGYGIREPCTHDCVLLP